MKGDREHCNVVLTWYPGSIYSQTAQYPAIEVSFPLQKVNLYLIAELLYTAWISGTGKFCQITCWQFILLTVSWKNVLLSHHINSLSVPYLIKLCPYFLKKILRIPQKPHSICIGLVEDFPKSLNKPSYQKFGALSSSPILPFSLEWKQCLHLRTFFSPYISFVPFFLYFSGKVFGTTKVNGNYTRIIVPAREEC